MRFRFRGVGTIFTFVLQPSNSQNRNFSNIAKNNVAFRRVSASAVDQQDVLEWVTQRTMGNISTSKFYDVIAMSRTERRNHDKMTLLVGEYANVQGAETLLPSKSAVFYLDFNDLSADVLRAVNPDVVISPVICATFDCLELAEFLEETEFLGRYRVVLENIPRPEIICREVRRTHPMLDFGVISEKPSPSKRLN
jgi:hypothetical protein